jgi:hypothetical protein
MCQCAPAITLILPTMPVVTSDRGIAQPNQNECVCFPQAMSANGNAVKKKKLKAGQGEGGAADASPPADGGDMRIALLDGAGAPVDEATLNEAAWTQLGQVLRVRSWQQTNARSIF